MCLMLYRIYRKNIAQFHLNLSLGSYLSLIFDKLKALKLKRYLALDLAFACTFSSVGLAIIVLLRALICAL